MGADPLDDIMGYLGLGAAPPRDQAVGSVQAPAAVAHVRNSDGERCLAAAGVNSLWLSGNDDAEWIEVRGPFATVRATRPKAHLLVTVRIDVERWADGGTPVVKSRDLTITAAERLGTPSLEIRYRTWKPLRLTREQARVVLRFLDAIRVFAMG